uniref:Ubiquitin-like protease family profile domain-containing protein n=1 Tax=Rhizophora mucronata TaxID=61149 RepID=A0A2P2JAB8_RHIMU
MGKKSLKSHDAETEPVFIDLVDPPLPNKVCGKHTEAVTLSGSERLTKKQAEEMGRFKLSSLHVSEAFSHHGQSRRMFKSKNARSKLKKELDTAAFECYLETLWRSFSEDKKMSFTYLDCLWFAAYMNTYSKKNVLAWIKGKHIFSKKYVLVPIVYWSHWSLLIFCHFGENLQSENTTPCMLLLDSLEMANPRRLEPEIRKFVLDIYRSGGRPEDKQLISHIPLLVPKVPQQRNGEECGKYVLHFINLFVQEAPENFSVEDYPYFMKDNWFGPEGVENLCERLKSPAK